MEDSQAPIPAPREVEIIAPPPIPPPLSPSENATNELKQKAAAQLAQAVTFVFGSGAMSEKSERNLCTLIHLAGCLFWFVPPLILWMWKRDQSAAVDAHGKEALNFQLTCFVATVGLSMVSCGVLGVIAYFSSIILAVIAAAKANQGKQWRYPVSVRLIK